MADEMAVAAKAESAKQNKQNRMPWIETLRRAAIFLLSQTCAVYSNTIAD
jgi:hypothetical protein